MRDIRRRIRSVKNTQQITKAMKMVSAAKLRKAQVALLSARPYAVCMQETLTRLAPHTNPELHPMLAVREGVRKAYVVVTADRGLCGGFNSNLLRKAIRVISEHKADKPLIFAVGRKGRDYFKRRAYKIAGDYT
ncbi:MAG: FoF1 ATP synthase subunit gamma, partial [bacterium]|nr:FoF1 ATP synthase subunit gamma [bacterium]